AVAPDRVGLLAALTAAFAAAGARVEAARVETVDGRAMDRFELAGPGGDKLTPAEVEAIRGALAAGVVSRKRPLRREWTLAAAP
nr:ACT domain-containing protein [Acidimicrobiales bacterium]